MSEVGGDLRLVAEINQCASDLRDNIMAASFNYDIWWTLKGVGTRSLYIETMNHYSLFFQASIHAHFVACLVACYRLLESRRGTQTLNRLVKLARRHPDFCDDTAARVDENLANMQAVHRKVAILRNNVFGHKSEKLTWEAAFEKAGITPDELKDHIGDAKTLYNTISQEIMDCVHAFNLSPAHDLERILVDLKARWEKQST